jgi:hypothetical protein
LIRQDRETCPEPGIAAGNAVFMAADGYQKTLCFQSK